MDSRTAPNRFYNLFTERTFYYEAAEEAGLPRCTGIIHNLSPKDCVIHHPWYSHYHLWYLQYPPAGGYNGGRYSGSILLFHFWFGMSSSILSPVLDALSYALGFRFLGKEFLKTSIFATICMAGFFRLWELFPPVLPSLADYPLLAALAGGCFIGTGCGLVVRQGASCAGDDALALVISKVTGCRISRAYLLTDVSVLVLSLSYIPAGRIVYSLITVTVSSFMIDFIQNFGIPRKDEDNGKETAADNG